MAAPPSNSVPTISPAEMQILVSRAGLVLNPGQVADLVLAWRQVAGLIASLPQDRPMADDLAYSFRLSPPTVTPTAKPVRAAAAKTPAKARGPAKKPASRRAAPAKKPAKAKTRRAAPAKAKSSRTARPKARSRATRRR